jgi:hypothetical protein
MTENLGTKITCPRCKKKYYSLDSKRPSCPNCAVKDLIPDATEARVTLKIRPGGYNDEAQGWTEGVASMGKTGAAYLNCEFTVIDGLYKNRKIFSLIGLRSPKGDWWGNKGRAFIGNIINSAHGILASDQSLEAIKYRKLSSLKDIDGLEFMARISIGKDANGKPKNEVEEAVVLAEPKEYEEPDTDRSASKNENSASPPLWLQ